MRLSKGSDDLPIYANDRRGQLRRQLTARNALGPLRLFLLKLRRPSIVALLALFALLFIFILREERQRAHGVLKAANTSIVTRRGKAPAAVAADLDKEQLALAERAREKIMRRLLATYDGLGGYFLGAEGATTAELAAQPAYVAPESAEGKAFQANGLGIYGGPGDKWSSGVSGIGLYIGPVDYKEGMPHTNEVRPDRTVDGKSRGVLESAIDGIVRRSPVVVFSKTTCPYSKRAKALLASLNLRPAPYVVEVDQRDDTVEIKDVLIRLTKHSTWPNIIIGGQHLGGSDDLARVHGDGSLTELLHQAGVFAW